MTKYLFSTKNFIYLFCVSIMTLTACKNDAKDKSETSDETSNLAISSNNADLTVPEGFGVIKVADSLGAARHIAVTKEGGIYVKLNQPKDGKGIVYLQDKDGDGVADSTSTFANYGGTGIYLTDESLCNFRPGDISL